MKLKNTLLASALLSATAFSVNAATELTPEQAAAGSGESRFSSRR